MPLKYDATVKDLAQTNPRGLLSAFDTPPDLPVSLLNVDLSTVTTAADVVFGLGQPLQEIVHLDFQSSASASKHADILVYGALLHRQYLVPIHSIVVLLRPQASHPNLHGTVAYAPRPDRGKMDFGFEVVRLWERPAEDLLRQDVGALPLAVLGQLPGSIELEAGLASVIARIVERLDREAASDQARRLLTASFVLSGLRVTRQTAAHLFQGVRAMRDSDTFMAILDEGEVKGRIREARKLIFRLGQKSLGLPTDDINAEIDAINDLERLESLCERIHDAKSWADLLNDNC